MSKQTQRCQDDSCDLSHCSSCGCHMLGQYLPPGTKCDECQQMEEEQNEQFRKTTEFLSHADYVWKRQPMR